MAGGVPPFPPPGIEPIVSRVTRHLTGENTLGSLFWASSVDERYILADRYRQLITTGKVKTIHRERGEVTRANEPEPLLIAKKMPRKGPSY